MAVRHIRLFPDFVLQTPCRPIVRIGPKTSDLLRDLKHTLQASRGVGLAAPQIGISLQAAVINVAKDPRKRFLGGSNHGLAVVINPQIVEARGLERPREGCLSVPDLLANVRRYAWVRVRALNAEGRQWILEVEGFEALAFQHEIDHLQGRLFLDRVADLSTDLYRRQDLQR